MSSPQFKSHDGKKWYVIDNDSKREIIIIKPDGTWQVVCEVVPEPVLSPVLNELSYGWFEGMKNGNTYYNHPKTGTTTHIHPYNGYANMGEPEDATVVEPEDANVGEQVVVNVAEQVDVNVGERLDLNVGEQVVVNVGERLDVNVVEHPDWWGDGCDTNNANGWTRCRTEWGGGYCSENAKRGYITNWEEAVIEANLLGDRCGGITKTSKGYSLRKSRQSMSVKITNGMPASQSYAHKQLACWSKDYIHDGQQFIPTRDPNDPIPYTREGGVDERKKKAIKYDNESLIEFEEWKSNGCK